MIYQYLRCLWFYIHLHWFTKTLYIPRQKRKLLTFTIASSSTPPTTSPAFTAAINIMSSEGEPKQPNFGALNSQEAIGVDLVSQEEEEKHEEYPSSWRLASLVTALVLSMFLASLNMTIIGTAIPRITEEFHSLDQIRDIRVPLRQILPFLSFMLISKQGWLVRLCVLPHCRRVPIDLGKMLQVFRSQGDFLDRYRSVRSGKFDMWCCSKQRSSHRWPSYNRG